MANIIISEEQLKNLILKKDKNLMEDTQDDDNKMLKQQLFTIATVAKKLHELIENDQPVEDWVKSKVAVADEIISTVAKNVMYGEAKEKTNGMDKLNFDDLIIGN
jgi:hypothetical protein